MAQYLQAQPPTGWLIASYPAGPDQPAQHQARLVRDESERSPLYTRRLRAVEWAWRRCGGTRPSAGQSVLLHYDDAAHIWLVARALDTDEDEAEVFAEARARLGANVLIAIMSRTEAWLSHRAAMERFIAREASR